MKILLKVLIVLLLINLFACNTNKEENKEEEIKDDKFTIVTTIFPIYDWTKEIIKGNDDIELIYLLDNGLDLHNYQASAQDIIKINNCDLFIYLGGESDEWVEDVLNNNDIKKLNLIDLLADNTLLEEHKEGMQVDEHEEEIDEHIYLSLKNAIKAISFINDNICLIDAENKELYNTNTTNYINSLKRLDNQYQNTIDNSINKTLIFADRFPFRYLIEDYNLDYYAAFNGCSAETEASFETIKFLTEKLNELSLNYLLVLENSDQKIAKTIIDNSNKQDCLIETLNSIQSIDINDNKTYLSIMKDNMEILKKVLN